MVYGIDDDFVQQRVLDRSIDLDAESVLYERHVYISLQSLAKTVVYYTATAFAPFITPLPAILLIWAAPKHLLWYNLVFVVPSLLNSTIVYSIWSRSNATSVIGQVKIIQAYSHCSALKDKIFGTAMLWVPTGDGRAHKSRSYTHMRLLCIAWTVVFEVLFIVGAAVRGSKGLIEWYNFMVGQARSLR